MKFDGYRQPDPATLQRAEIGFDEAIREGVGKSDRFHDALRRRQLAIAPEINDWGIVTGLLIVDLAARL